MKKSIFLFFAAILCAMSVSAKVIYFKPNGNWAQGGANFYAHVWGGSGVSSPVKFTPVATDPDVYEAEVGTHNQVIFLRMNPAKTVTSSNMWTHSDNGGPMWNRMGNLSIPTDGKNCCTIKDGQWSQDKNTTNGASSYVTWSTYTPPTVVVIPDRYITGTLAGGWNANDVKMTYDEATETYSHTFTAVAAGEPHQFKVTDGTWSKNWGGDAVSPAIEGVTTGSDGNVAFTLSTGGDVTITFKDSKIQLTTTGSFTPVETFDYYVVGSFNGWNTADAAYGMTKEGDVYKKEVTFAAAVQFKVCKGSWEAGAWGANNLGDNKYKELGGTDNLEMKEEKTFTIIFNPAQDLLTFEGLTPEAVVKYDYYLIGSINGWVTKDENFGMTDEDADGVYEKEVTLTANNKHELKINNGSWDDNTQIFGFDQLNVAYEGVSRGSGDGDNNVVIELTEDKTITVKFDKNAGKITLDGLTEKVVVKYDYYLTGSLVGGWDVKQQGIEKDGELYKATFTELNAGIYEFKITAGDWEHQWNYNNLGAAYEEVSQGVDGEGKPNGNIKIDTDEAKTITVIFDATAGKITLDGLTPYVAPLTYTVTVPAGTEKCYIAGAFAQSNWNTFVEMDKVDGEDKFTITIVGAKETDEYKYACQADWAYAEVIEGGGNRTQWTALDNVTAWNAPAEPTEVKCYLMGNGDWVNGVEMTLNPDNDNEYMLLDHHISAPFKFKLGNDWSDQVENYDFPGIKWENDNIELPEGIYDFYFKKDTKKAYIAAVYLRDVTNTWGTICLPHASTSFSGAKFYEVSSLDPTKGLWLDEIEAGTQLVAGKPYVFEATASTIKVTYTDAPVAAPVAGEKGLTGTFTDIAAAAGSVLVGNYIIAQNAVHVATASNDLPAYRAYIANTVPTTEQPQLPGRRRVCMGENAATGLDQIVAPAGQAVKVIENGQLIIIRDGVKYNVQGQVIK